MKSSEVSLHRYCSVGQAVVFSAAWFVPSLIHPLWPSLKMSLIILSALFFIFHVYYTISNSGTKALKSYDPSKQLAHLQRTASILQKGSLLGLGIIIVGLFMIKDNILTGSGIGIMLLMGIEFLVYTYSAWNLEEDIRRASKK